MSSVLRLLESREATEKKTRFDQLKSQNSWKAKIYFKKSKAMKIGKYL